MLGKSKWGLSKWGLKALVHYCLPPPAEKITKLIRLTFFQVITDFQLPIFPVIAPT